MDTSTMTFRSIFNSALGRLTGLALVATLGLAICAGVAQSAPTSNVTAAGAKSQFYDVVSIKLNKSGPYSMSVNSDDHLYTARNVTIQDLISHAYAVREDLVSGVVGPLASARFDIDAKVIEPDVKAVHDMSEKEYGAMLLPMLQERFKLQAHIETKILPVYDLVVVKSGVKFKEAQPGDTKRKGTSIHDRELEAVSISMQAMAKTLSYQVHRTVIDKTGLPGDYDFLLKWSRDDGAALDDGSKDAPPHIFTALEEQLGLKLVPAKGPVETIVVDHVEMPSEN